MADNILTKDRTDANISLAAKDNGSVLFPRNIITDPSGNDITPLTDDQLRASAVPVEGPLTDAQLRATSVNVSYSNTEATPLHTKAIDAPFTRVGFAEVGSGIIGNAANVLELRKSGSGMAVSQSAGNLE